jgi:hypothetical protein
MDHNHTECKHKEIKYCEKCCLTYCISCGREWVDRCMLSHYNYTYISTPHIPNPPYYVGDPPYPSNPWFGPTTSNTEIPCTAAHIH